MKSLEGTCGACLNRQKLDPRGRMVLHGYQRPGQGWIIGRCPGVARQPWEISPEGGVAYLDGLKHVLSSVQREEHLFVHNEVEFLTITDYSRYIPAKFGGRKRGGYEQINIGPADPRWKAAADAELRRIRENIKKLSEEIHRTEKRIAEWKPGKLASVEQLKAEELQARAATLSWDPEWATWTTKSAAGRTIATGSTVSGVVEALKQRGWHIDGDMPPDVRMIDHITAIATEAVPQGKAISRYKIGPVSARALVETYELLSPEFKDEFNITGTKPLMDEVDHAADMALNKKGTNYEIVGISPEKLAARLSMRFAERIAYRNRVKTRRRA